MASTSMRTTGRVMPMMAGAKPTRLRPGASGSSNEPKPAVGPGVLDRCRLGTPSAAGRRRRVVVVPGVDRDDRRRAVAPPCARAPASASARAAGRAAGRRADAEQREVVRRLGHPLVDEAREQRSGHDDRRDRDDDAEDQGAPEVGVEQADRGERARGAAAPARAAPTGRPGRGCRPSSATARCAGPRGRPPGTSSTTPTSKNSGRPRMAAMAAITHGRPPGPDPADHRRDDAVGPAGVLEQLADHRPERDEDADRAGRRAEPGDEALDGVARRHRRHRAEHGRAEHQGQERVHLGPGDEHDDGEDAEDARQRRAARSRRTPGVRRRPADRRGGRDRRREVR